MSVTYLHGAQKSGDEDTIALIVRAMKAVDAETFGDLIDYCRKHKTTPIQLAGEVE